MNKKHYFIIILVSFLTVFNCKAQKYNKSKQLKEIETKFNITNAELKTIKNSDSIVRELSKCLTINDSLKLFHINRRLDSFFLKKYNEKELISMLEMERLLRSKSSAFEIDRSIDSTKALNFKSLEEFMTFEDSVGIKDAIKINNVRDKDSLQPKKKDSLKQKKGQ